MLLVISCLGSSGGCGMDWWGSSAWWGLIACGFTDSWDSCGFPVIQNNVSLHVVFAYAIGLVIDCVVVLILCDRICLFVCVWIVLLRFGNLFDLFVQEQLLIVMIPIQSLDCSRTALVCQSRCVSYACVVLNKCVVCHSLSQWRFVYLSGILVLAGVPIGMFMLNNVVCHSLYTS